MKEFEKAPAKEAAQMFVTKHFPQCQAALLSGSVVRGEETETSDLDIIIFDDILADSYRESLMAFGWPIEIFAHNFQSYKQICKTDYERARPSMLRMVSEGIILKGHKIIDDIKKEADEILAEGPAKWSEETIRIKRYFITDALDDLIGSNNRAESIFIANTLADLVHEFVLRTNGHWIGASKWMMRSLREFDQPFAEEYFHAFDTFYKHGEIELVVKLVEAVLEPHGGRLFEGFSIGKGEPN
ncbi:MULTISPECIES: nucleotidyltransferase [unclassified Bacillus (in: firmicutes)]|uniref:nucleotidyltransferase n=1 Tax=unclassified Bacillus (in: firmicutes) TaxID=185979 RepID=UPI0008E4A6D1|nr:MULTISPECIES: nucleotidyltransferase [unclassified Bacillus (in: firmicutes)]SFA85924.1 hypothetical protein SAMN02799634_10272 [Bacillus sp. UNCCL13]SFQ83546.1 hypothetical protein SAMN04488577_2191 [Bacillus sp. cl95]